MKIQMQDPVAFSWPRRDTRDLREAKAHDCLNQ